MVFQTNAVEQSKVDEAPLQSAARNTTDFTEDIFVLAELQSQLLLLETRDWCRSQSSPAMFFVAAWLIAAGLIPIALLAFSAALVEFAAFSMTLALVISLIIGLCLSGALLAAARLTFNKQQAPFLRSSNEWKANVRWLRNMVRRQGRRW
ncbi:MAG: hypothetical protein WCJ09_21220 [Planctomycetota bacterium]